MYTLEGENSVSNFVTAYKKNLSQIETPLFCISVFFVSEVSLLDFYLSSKRLTNIVHIL